MKILILAVFLSLLSTGFAFDDLNQSSEPDSPDEYWLGIAYANGIDVEQNKTTAAMFFKISGMLGHGPSQRNLGIMHGLGDGIPENFILAYAWLSIASINKDEVAPLAREDICKNMTEKEKNMGRQKALEILQLLIDRSKNKRRQNMSHPIR